MPYRIFKVEDQFCVYKVDQNKQRVGESFGCHKRKIDAAKQITAINISEHQNENSMMHYGVLGMRWGRRKGSSSHPDSSRVKKLRKKRLSELSNEELEALTKRLNLEKQYRSLTPTAKSRFRKAMNEVLANTGKELLKDAIKSGATAAGKVILESAKK